MTQPDPGDSDPGERVDPPLWVDSDWWHETVAPSEPTHGDAGSVRLPDVAPPREAPGPAAADRASATDVPPADAPPANAPPADGPRPAPDEATARNQGGLPVEANDRPPLLAAPSRPTDDPVEGGFLPVETDARDSLRARTDNPLFAYADLLSTEADEPLRARVEDRLPDARPTTAAQPGSEVDSRGDSRDLASGEIDRPPLDPGASSSSSGTATPAGEHHRRPALEARTGEVTERRLARTAPPAVLSRKRQPTEGSVARDVAPAGKPGRFAKKPKPPKPPDFAKPAKPAESAEPPKPPKSAEPPKPPKSAKTARKTKTPKPAKPPKSAKPPKPPKPPKDRGERRLRRDSVAVRRLGDLALLLLAVAVVALAYLALAR